LSPESSQLALGLSLLRCQYKSEQSQNTQNPLLGGVPVGRGGLVSRTMTNPPLPLPLDVASPRGDRGDLLNCSIARTFMEGRLPDLCVHGRGLSLSVPIFKSLLPAMIASTLHILGLPSSHTEDGSAASGISSG
jgi:hypothetical protein